VTQAKRHIHLTRSTSTVRWAFAIAALVLIQGCGFHLRGSNETLAHSYPLIDLKCDRKSEFRMCHDLSTRIVAMGSSISEEADISLNVSRVSSKQRAFTLDTDASAAEYELRHRIKYELLDKVSDQKLAGRIVERQQIYRHSASALIAKDREQENISKQLDDAIIDTILREISLVRLATQQTTQ